MSAPETPRKTQAAQAFLEEHTNLRNVSQRRSRSKTSDPAVQAFAFSGDMAVPEHVESAVRRFKQDLKSLLPDQEERTLRDIAYRSAHPPGTLRRAMDPNNPRLPAWPQVEALVVHSGCSSSGVWRKTWERLARAAQNSTAEARRRPSPPVPIPKNAALPKEPTPRNEAPPPDPGQATTPAELVALLQELMGRAGFSFQELADRIKHVQGGNDTPGLSRTNLNNLLSKKWGGRLPENRRRYEMIITACDPHLALDEWRAAWARATASSRRATGEMYSPAEQASDDETHDLSEPTPTLPSSRTVPLWTAVVIFAVGVLLGASLLGIVLAVLT